MKDNKPYFCSLCDQTHPPLKNRGACPTCGRIFCVDSIEESIQRGMLFCPYCEHTKFTQFHGFKIKSSPLKGIQKEPKKKVRIPIPTQDEDEIFALKFFFWMYIIFGGFIFSTIGYFYHQLCNFGSSRDISEHQITLRFFIYSVYGISGSVIAAIIGLFLINLGLFTDLTIFPALGLLIIPILLIRLIRRDFDLSS